MAGCPERCVKQEYLWPQNSKMSKVVKLLVARNVLVIRRGKGTCIASNPGEVEDPLGFAFYPDQMTLARDFLCC